MNVDFGNLVLRHRFHVVLYRLLNFERKRRNVAVAVNLYADVGNYALFFEVEFYALFLLLRRTPPRLRLSQAQRFR